MKKLLPLLTIFLFVISGVFAQGIENPGFEEWEDAGTVIDEPVNWSSIKTSDDDFLSGQAPVVWEQSTDAHTGSYSVKLHNVLVLPGLVASGTLTNGRLHADFNPDNGYAFTDTSDDQWNTPINYRPESIAFWMKFFPEGNDTMQFQAALHVGEFTLPPKESNQANMVAYNRADIPGEHAEWTRFEIPFDYVNDLVPEYILIILTSGNGTEPVEGSYALFDDIELVGTQSIRDNILDDNSVYVANRMLYLKNLPQDILQDSRVEVVDLTGRAVLQKKVTSSTVSLDSPNISEGLYIIRLISSKKVYSKKFFIQ